MSKRKYSVSEIDQMRSALEHEYLFGRGGVQNGGMSRTYYANEKEAAVEQRLRTYMQNGTDPDELTTAIYGS